MQSLTTSVSRKLTLLIVLVSTIITMVACTSLIVSDVSAFRSYKSDQTRALGQVFAYDAAAVLHFGQPEMAAELLAPLHSHPTVNYACIRDADGNLLAEFNASDRDEAAEPLPADAPPAVPGDAETGDASGTTDSNARADSHARVDSHARAGAAGIDRDTLTIEVPIEEDGERLGTLELRSTLADVDRQVDRNILVAICLMGVCLVMSFVLANFVQRSISRPILQLAETADRISHNGDYSVRVQSPSKDEIGILYHRFNEMLEHIEEGKRQLTRAKEQLEARVQKRTQELSKSNAELQCQIVQREETSRRLAETHDQLTLAARRAGMAEIASGVLHNVGNVLNSVNVSAEVVFGKIRHSRVHALSKAVALMNENRRGLGTFIEDDDRGKLLPEYLTKVSDSLEEENQSILQELGSLQNCVEHMKEIISKQQSLARFGGTRQPTDLQQVIEDAISINAVALQRHRIELVREFSAVPEINTDKHKILQVLVNLVKNAKDALHDTNIPQKSMRIRLVQSGDDAVIEVQDNGSGIATENLDRMFQHGFTTKQEGHGFGLHSSAISAKEVGGSLSVHSDGLGKGATFTLRLPVHNEEESLCQA